MLWAMPVAAQSSLSLSPVSLRAAMLYGAEVESAPSVVNRDTSAYPLRMPRTSSPNDLTAQLPSSTSSSRSVLPDTLRDPWLGRDKALHAAGSFLLTLSGQYVLTSKLGVSEDGALPITAGATLSLGLAKEIADSRRAVRPFFSVRDLVADAVGVALAAGLILL